MNEYRIKHFYSTFYEKELYMPQIKRWWGWQDLFEFSNQATYSEESALSYIKRYERVWQETKARKEEQAKLKKSIKTSIIKVNTKL